MSLDAAYPVYPNSQLLIVFCPIGNISKTQTTLEMLWLPIPVKAIVKAPLKTALRCRIPLTATTPNGIPRRDGSLTRSMVGSPSRVWLKKLTTVVSEVLNV